MKSKLNWLEAALLLAPFLRARPLLDFDLPARVPTPLGTCAGRSTAGAPKTPGLLARSAARPRRGRAAARPVLDSIRS